jgi:putative redox protein
MQIEREPEGHRIARLALDIHLPPGFPEKHRDAVVRAADLCAVKKHILQPPTFEIRAV